jgi:hypothetical protein
MGRHSRRFLRIGQLLRAHATRVSVIAPRPGKLFEAERCLDRVWGVAAQAPKSPREDVSSLQTLENVAFFRYFL